MIEDRKITGGFAAAGYELDCHGLGLAMTRREIAASFSLRF